MLLVMGDIDAMLIQEVQRILAEIYNTKRDIAIAHGELLKEINVLKSVPIDDDRASASGDVMVGSSSYASGDMMEGSSSHASGDMMEGSSSHTSGDMMEGSSFYAVPNVSLTDGDMMVNPEEIETLDDLMEASDEIKTGGDVLNSGELCMDNDTSIVIEKSSSPSILSFSDDSQDGRFLWLDNVNVDNANAILDKDTLLKAQAEDPKLSRVLEWVGKGKKPPFKDVKDCYELHSYWTVFDRIKVFDGVLYIMSLGGDPHSIVIVPVSLRRQVISVMHESPAGAHFSDKLTYLNLKDFGWFPKIKRQIRGGCRHCLSCK